MRINKRGLRAFKSFGISLVKNGVTSGGSRLNFSYKRTLPLNIKHKKLITTIASNGGRTSTGRIAMWTRKKRYFKKRNPSINYSFRQNVISFIANIVVLPFSHKLVSLVFTSTGSASYIPTNYSHELLSISKSYSMFTNTRAIKDRFNLLNPLYFIKQTHLLIKFLPKHRPVSQLESVPGAGIKYVRSAGSSAKITKVDRHLNTALVKLPSGVRKVFSVFSIGSPHVNPLHENKYWKSNKAGYYSQYGRKPITRGIAMNPIDHPHGGRTKAIDYPRTP